MTLIPTRNKPALLKNWAEDDPFPVIKIFSPIGAATWLVCSMDPTDEDRLFGLADLGFGTPELGYFSLSELEAIRVRIMAGVAPGGPGLPLERELYFTPTQTIDAYAIAARRKGLITTNREALESAR